MRRQKGFTLVEVLIGITILALMMTLLTSALFGMVRGVRVGEARIDAADDFRLIRSFLREQLSGAVPLTERDDDRQQVLFEGRPESLRFIGHLPAHRGGGGLQFLELRTEADAVKTSWVLYYRDAWPDVSFATSIGSEWERHVLVANVDDTRFRYFGAPDDDVPASWRDDWRGVDRLPALIEIHVEALDGPAWPSLVAAVRSRTAVSQTRLFRRGSSSRASR